MSDPAVVEEAVANVILRPPSPIVAPLATAQGPTLVGAYLLWWRIYTEGIRRSPSVNRPEGVASEHVVPVAREANAAVLEFLSESELSQ